MSLYAQYIMERAGKGIIENDRGYVTFSDYRDGILLEDLYVVPEFRKQGEAIKFVYSVIDLVKANDLKKIYICVSPGVETPYVGATAMCKALIHHGCKLDHSMTNLLILSKEVN